MQLQEIAERCQQGDREAFALLYTATRQQLRAVCLSYVKNEAVADDLLHDAFLLIFSKIGELKETARTEAWLTMVMRRVALLYLRKQRQQGWEPLSSCAVSSLQSLMVDNGAESSLAVQEMLAAVDSLPKGYRRVFRLSALEGISHQEIATLLNIEPHSSSSQLARAKRMLQRMMSGYWIMLLLLLVPVGFWLFRHIGEPPSVCTSSGGFSISEASDGYNTMEDGEVAPLPSRGGVCSDPCLPSRGRVRSDACLSKNPSPTREGSGCADTLLLLAKTDSTMMECPEVSEVPEILENPETPDNPDIPEKPENLEILEIPEASPSHWHIDLASNGQWSMLSSSKNGQSSMQLPYADADTNPMVSDSLSRHHLPLTIALSAGYRLNRHWQLGTGLSYSRLTSDFCSGNTYVSLQQHQTVQYLGIPVSITHLSPLTSRLSLLTSVSTTLHLPLHSTLESHYLMPDGTIAEPTTQSLHPGVQWSTGLGVGLQYELTPHVGLFIQPSLQYYFKDGGNVSTWNTEHPCTFSIPFGVMISF